MFVFDLNQNGIRLPIDERERDEVGRTHPTIDLNDGERRLIDPIDACRVTQPINFGREFILDGHALLDRQHPLSKQFNIVGVDCLCGQLGQERKRQSG
jgi:hypothetical protein